MEKMDITDSTNIETRQRSISLSSIIKNPITAELNEKNNQSILTISDQTNSNFFMKLFYLILKIFYKKIKLFVIIMKINPYLKYYLFKKYIS